MGGVMFVLSFLTDPDFAGFCLLVIAISVAVIAIRGWVPHQH